MGNGNRKAWAIGAAVVALIALVRMSPWRSDPSAIDRACDAVGDRAFEWEPFQYAGPISEQWPTVLPDDEFGLDLGVGNSEWMVEPTRKLADAVVSHEVRSDMLVLAKAYEDRAAGDSRDTVRARYGASTIKRAMHEATRFVRRECESAPLAYFDPCTGNDRWQQQECADLWSSVSTLPPIVFSRCDPPADDAPECVAEDPPADDWDTWDDSDYADVVDDPYGWWYDLQAYEYADRQSGP